MKWILSILAFFILLGCHSNDFSKIEFITTYGRALDYKNTDSLIFGLYIEAYAQIDNDGNCLIMRRSNKNDKLFNSFKIDKQLLNLIGSRIVMINKDTFLTVESNREMYDGPIIQLYVHKDNGSLLNLNYLKSRRTDKDFLRFYNYIDSMNNEKRYNSSFDTTKLKIDRDKLVDKMKKQIFESGNTFGRDTIVIIK
jgi:hypothetical protein